MHVRHQHGDFRSVERKAGPPVWEFLWRETHQSGNRVRPNVVIGTLEEYPTVRTGSGCHKRTKDVYQ